MNNKTAPNFLTNLSRVITDLTNPHNDLKKDSVLNDQAAKMRAVKNTVCFALGYKSGSDYDNSLKSVIQREDNDDYKKYIHENLDNIISKLSDRFGIAPDSLKILSGDKVILKGSYHPSGRFYLDYRHQRRGLNTPLFGVFFGNFERREFYKAAFRLYHFLMSAGYDVEFENIIRLDNFQSVYIPLDINVHISLRDWVNRRFDSETEEVVRKSFNKVIFEKFESMGLQYQINDFGEFDATHMSFSLSRSEEGVLLPEIYFTERSLLAHQLQPYR